MFRLKKKNGKNLVGVGASVFVKKNISSFSCISARALLISVAGPRSAIGRAPDS